MVGASRVLLVGAEPADPVAVELTRAGATVVRAATTGAAMDLLNGTDPELVVVDMRLPALEAWRFLRDKDRSATCRGVPTVLVTAPWGWELNRLTVSLYAWLRYDWAVAPAWMAPEHVGMMLNVLLFVPAGALLVALTPVRWWGAVALGAATSG